MKSMNREGAIAGMLTGMLFTFSYIVYFKLMQPSANIPANWLFGISPEGIGFIGMILNFAAAMTVSRFTNPSPLHITAMVSNIRIPVGIVKDYSLSTVILGEALLGFVPPNSRNPFLSLPWVVRVF